MIHYYPPQPPVVYHEKRPVRSYASVSAPVVPLDELKREAARARERAGK